MPQKSKSSKVSSKKGNYVKNPAPDDDPQKLANDSPISEEQTDRIGETGSVLTTHKDCVFALPDDYRSIEGHYILSQQNKTTKYEHVIPLLVSVEEDERIDGLLVLINTVGGDVEAGLAIAEVISGMKKADRFHRTRRRSFNRNSACCCGKEKLYRKECVNDGSSRKNNRPHTRSSADL